jgi:mannose-6-phosphate isomerase
VALHIRCRGISWRSDPCLQDGINAQKRMQAARLPLHWASRKVMAQLDLTQPLVFEPIFLERIWGGRRLESEFGKKLPPNRKIGEAWEIVDRPEAQSVVRDGPLRGQTLHDLWINHRIEIFGALRNGAPRFPLLIKLLDARDKLSLQVHPPGAIAAAAGGEPKTEFWYVAKADPGATIFAGLREATSADEFKRSIEEGTVADQVHSIPVRAGDAMFLPAGRFHAIGAGNLLVEVQQNSDSTYRVFDWNRKDDEGRPRPLHLDLALQSIDFEDRQPELVTPKGEILVSHELFEVQKWTVEGPRQISALGQFAIICILEGELDCAGIRLKPGELCLVPAQLPDQTIRPVASQSSLLRITIPAS